LGEQPLSGLRTRPGDVRLVLTDERGEEIVVEAKNVRCLDVDGVIELTEGSAAVHHR
jgi:hypothetical protein